RLPSPPREPTRTLVFFPGSTLGNFTPAEAVKLLAAMRETIGRDGRALVGIDLVKDRAVLEAAYNDAAGVTAEFTLNLLARLNRELDADFDLSAFAHQARYVPQRERIETRIVSLRPQRVHVAGLAFDFAEGEPIEVEYSHKYSDQSFATLAARAGLEVVDGWGGEPEGFGLRLLRQAARCPMAGHVRRVSCSGFHVRIPHEPSDVPHPPGPVLPAGNRLQRAGGACAAAGRGARPSHSDRYHRDQSHRLRHASRLRRLAAVARHYRQRHGHRCTWRTPGPVRGPGRGAGGNPARQRGDRAVRRPGAVVRAARRPGRVLAVAAARGAAHADPRWHPGVLAVLRPPGPGQRRA